MDDDQKHPEHEAGQTGRDEPSPFNPDARLITRRERSRKDVALQRFRKAVEDQRERSS